MRRHQRRRDRCAPMLIAAGALSTILASQATAATWYVDADAQGANDGSSWTDAWTDLQSALTSQSVGADDVIWVADGTYKPTEGITFPQGEEREQSFIVKTDISVYGGFIGGDYPGGGEEYLSDRDVHGNLPAVLSGDIDALGTDDSYHVVREPNGGGVGQRVDGFQIESGRADGSDLDATNIGGGMLMTGFTVVNCHFKANHGEMGAGLYIRNTAGAGDSYVSNCRFNGNVASIAGGGMYVTHYGPHHVENCLFHENEGLDAGGGAICVANATALHLVNCTIADNNTDCDSGLGGGIRVYGNGVVRIANSILWANWDSTCEPTGPPPHPVCSNAVQVYPANVDNAQIKYTDIQGGWFGSNQGNLEVDPLFDTAPGNYHLTSASTVRNVGYVGELAFSGLPGSGTMQVPSDDVKDVDDDGKLLTELTPDLDLSIRVSNPNVGDDGGVDMGAYEFCDSDVNEDGVTDILDLLAVLEAWGNESGPADINEDEIVNVLDLLRVLAEWGCGTRNPEAPPQDVQDCIDKYGDDIEQMIGCIEAILLTEE